MYAGITLKMVMHCKTFQTNQKKIHI